MTIPDFETYGEPLSATGKERSSPPFGGEPRFFPRRRRVYERTDPRPDQQEALGLDPSFVRHFVRKISRTDDRLASAAIRPHHRELCVPGTFYAQG